MSGSVDVAAQWANDPLGRFEVRYWDGSQWTEHVANGGVAALDPLDVAVPAAGVVASDGVSSEVAAVVPVDTAWAAQDDAAAVPVDTAWAAQDDAAVVPVVADARSGAMLAPAQWAPDPLRRHELRYWDGVAWTDHVWGAGVQAVDPVSVAPTVPISPMTPASADAAPGLVAAPTSVKSWTSFPPEVVPMAHSYLAIPLSGSSKPDQLAERLVRGNCTSMSAPVPSLTVPAGGGVASTFTPSLLVTLVSPALSVASTRT